MGFMRLFFTVTGGLYYMDIKLSRRWIHTEKTISVGLALPARTLALHCNVKHVRKMRHNVEPSIHVMAAFESHGIIDIGETRDTG